MCARLAIFSRTMLATVHRDRPSMPSGLIVLSVVATFVVRQEHIVILDRAPPMRRGILAGPGLFHRRASAMLGGGDPLVLCPR